MAPRSCIQLACIAAGQLTAKNVKKVTSLQEAITFLSSHTTKVRTHAPTPDSSVAAVRRVAAALLALWRRARVLLAVS